MTARVSLPEFTALFLVLTSVFPRVSVASDPGSPGGRHHPITAEIQGFVDPRSLPFSDSIQGSDLDPGSESHPVAPDCPSPDVALDSFAAIEKLSCDVEVANETVHASHCEECPNLRGVQDFRRKTSPTEAKRASCERGLLAIACGRSPHGNSPWKGKTLPERYEKFMEYAKEAETPTYTKELLVCMAARETLYLDPISVTCSGGPGVTQTGLGHVNRATFLDMFQADTESSAVAWKKIRAANWLKPMSCAPSGKSAKVWLAEIHATRYQRDPRIQIHAMVGALQRKAKFKACRTANPGMRVKCAVRLYNGSSGKIDYANDVMACNTCLKKLAPGESPTRCLDLASQENLPADGDICAEGAMR